MQICKILTMYYFLPFQCKLNLRSNHYSSENLQQSVRLLNVMPLSIFSLKQWRTAGLLKAMCCQTV